MRHHCHYPTIGQEKRVHEEASVYHMEGLGQLADTTEHGVHNHGQVLPTYHEVSTKAHFHGKALAGTCSHHWAHISHEELYEAPVSHTEAQLGQLKDTAEAPQEGTSEAYGHGQVLPAYQEVSCRAYGHEKALLTSRSCANHPQYHGLHRQYCAHIFRRCNHTTMDQDKEAHEEAWETLASHIMAVADDKEEALEPLERMAHQLEGCACPCDLLFEAWFMLSTAYAFPMRLQPQKCLFYALKALKCYDAHKADALRSKCLYLSGYAYYIMGRFEDAVSQLEECTSILSKTTNFSLECNQAEFKARYYTGKAKTSLGKWKAGIDNFHKALEAKQKMLPCMEQDLGPLYREIAHAYRVLKDHEGAMHFCNTAIQFFTKHYGPGSREVAEARVLRSAIYYDLEKYKDTLTECEAVRPTLEQFGQSAQADVLVAMALFHLQCMEEAIWRLEKVIKDTPETSILHLEALVYLARFCCVMKNGASAAKYCQKAFDLLETQPVPAVDMATFLTILSQVLESQQISEKAVAAKKCAQYLLEKYDTDNNITTVIADNDGKLGRLLLCDANKAEEAVPYLEFSVSRKISVYGPRNKELLLPHMHLGMAYSQVGRLNEALEQFEVATAILSNNVDVDDELIKPVINSNLASIYKALGRYEGLPVHSSSCCVGVIVHVRSFIKCC